MTTCAVEGCDAPSRKRGWCMRHWKRWYDNGSTFRDLDRPVLDRVMDRVNKAGPVSELRGTPCWIWQGHINPRTGYGRTHLGGNGKLVMAHRLVYSLLVGPIPEGHQIDHLCRVRACVRPDHLEAVTQEENNRRAAFLRRDPTLAEAKAVTLLKALDAVGIEASIEQARQVITRLPWVGCRP